MPAGKKRQSKRTSATKQRKPKAQKRKKNQGAVQESVEETETIGMQCSTDTSPETSALVADSQPMRRVSSTRASKPLEFSSVCGLTWSSESLKRLPVQKTVEHKQVTEAEASELLASFPELNDMLDRTGSVPVAVYILSTLTNGLPLFSSQPTVNEDVKHCLNYIFHRVREEKSESERRRLVMEVARAYQQCQTIQQQAIVNLYASLVNVVLDFKAQLLQMLSQYKLRKLDELVFKLNPGANEVPDSYPNRQPPHIRSAYICALDAKGIQLEGLEASQLDVNRPNLSKAQITKVVSGFASLLDVDEFVADFVADINHSAGFAQHVDRDKFYSWVMKMQDKQGEQPFEKHSIFYSEERADEYPTPQKEEDRDIKPYLSNQVARDILTRVGILKKA
eukprot:g21843.t1